MTHDQTNSNLAAKPWIEKRLKTLVMVPCPNIVKFGWKVVFVTPTNMGSCTMQHDVAPYEQKIKRLSYFSPRWNVQQDAVHARPVNIYL